MTSVIDLKDKRTSLSPQIKNDASLAAARALSRARLLAPYLAHFLNAMDIIATEEVGDTFAVSPDLVLVYNPLFVLGMNEAGEGMTEWEFGISFLHESMHIVFNHQARWMKYNTKHKIENNGHNRYKWNVAGDCEINVILRKLNPTNPNFEAIYGAAYKNGGTLGTPNDATRSAWNLLSGTQKQAKAEQVALKFWKTLPLEGRPFKGKYPQGMGADWPVNGVSMPEWFCFPEKLNPPQGPKGTAETYYPFVGGERPPGPRPDRPPPPPPEEWKGWKVGDRVVDRTTGEVGIVTRAGPYDPNGTPPQEIEITITNHFTEKNRSIEVAEEIGAVERAKRAAGITPQDERAVRREVVRRNEKIERESGWEGMPHADKPWDKPTYHSDG